MGTTVDWSGGWLSAIEGLDVDGRVVEAAAVEVGGGVMEGRGWEVDALDEGR